MTFTVDVSLETTLAESSEGLDVQPLGLTILVRSVDRGLRVSIDREDNGYAIACLGVGDAGEHVFHPDELYRAYLKRVALYWPEAADKAAVHRVANRIARLLHALE